LGSVLLLNVVAVFALLPMGTSQNGQVQPYATTRSPHGNLNIACQNCHTVSGWKPIRAVPEFDHNRTKFPLRGLHESVTCEQCHTKPVFTNVGTKCADCHADIHRRQLGANCEQCHSVKGWHVSVQQIQQHQNRFPLLGAHAAVDCDSCHKGAATSKYETMSSQCYSCHAKDYQQSTSPSHAATGFPTTCEQCHGMDNWLGAKFDHGAVTGFALMGAHATLQCSQCHIGGRYKGTPAQCVGCHMPDFQKTTNPSHVKLSLPQTCQSCHNTSTWIPATFDHSLVGFPLTGAHATLQCAQCHTNGNYNLTTTDCASCHLKDYQGTTNPNHAQSGIPTTCATCHNTTSWANASFNHATTGFPLTGLHTVPPRQCADCHVNNNYNLTNTACVSCHLKDYQGTTDPNHVMANFPQTCQQCHNTASWGGATFNHATTGFALTGAHTTLQCSLCHVNGNYNLTSGACATCHMKDYQGTTDPNHVQAGFPTTCDSCHTTVSWAGANFNHASTGFALTGLHTVPPRVCADCHVNGNYKLTSGACVTCHLKDFQGTTDPNHVSAGFPQTCDTCHSTSSWSGATFNHNNTPFPLTGAHTSVACSSCHVNNNYTTLPTACYGCHQKDYQGTTNPNHVAAGFPTSCQTCHTTASWLGATFNHTWFPTNHGGANGVCTTCHTNPSNFAVFVCTNCHTKSTTDSHHQGVSGYVYNSPNCYQCHPNGSTGG
jgi:decaheme cytochrome c component MtrC/MtrF-like protein